MSKPLFKRLKKSLKTIKNLKSFQNKEKLIELE